MVDLSMHLMDIVQNSIRAKAKTIDIMFEEKTKEQILTFVVHDDGMGMNKEMLKKMDDPFFTTRITRKVGLGVPLLKMTCEQTGGSFEVKSEPKMGTTVKAVYRTDHPDCLPLGDIAGTLALLLKANPEIRFRVLYRLDDDEFRFDSDELKQLGIDLNTAEIFFALKEFFTANFEELFRKRSSGSYLC
ncbi:ATP-binding protein [Dysgonamonadaceae bacterium]|nr:ATP-binding protein [Dysgonamonadaceae bacterium]